MDIEAQIKEAFHSVRLNGAPSIRQCIALDNRLPKDAEQFRDIRDHQFWWDIPKEQIEKIGPHGVLVHGGNEGLLFHLPAAMLYLIQEFTEFNCTENAENVYSMTMISIESSNISEILSASQKLGIVAFLKYMQKKLSGKFIVVEPQEVLTKIQRNCT